MKCNKYSVSLSRFFSVIFTSCFALLLILIVLFGYERERNPHTFDCSFLQHLAILLTAAVIVVTGYAVYSFLKSRRLSKLRDVDTELLFKIILASAVVIMFSIQLYTSNRLAADSQDLKVIDKFAQSFGRRGDFALVGKMLRSGKNTYIIKYPNNYALLFILSAIYRTGYLLTGKMLTSVPVILNIISIDASVILTVMLAKRLYGKRRALYVLALCFVFSPYYTLTAYYYTDTLSMPFVIGSVYLYFYALERDNHGLEAILMALTGLVISIGFKIKGSLILILTVSLVYLFFKLSVKRSLCLALALCMGFCSGCAGFRALSCSVNLCTAEERYANEYPYTHWVMMGLKGYGGFSKTDSEFTRSFENKDLKRAANIGEINKRLRKMGIKGMASHIVRKAVWTWEDGTYYSARLLEKYKSRCFLHDVLLNDGRFHFPYYAFCCGLQLFIIAGMTLSGINALRKRSSDKLLLLRLAVFSLFVFLLIWETRSRYLLNFSPFYILLSCDGMEFVNNKISIFKSKGVAKKATPSFYSK